MLSEYNYTRDPVIPIDVVGSMIRMGRKHKIECLEEEGLRCMKTEFPQTLAKWDARDSANWTELCPSDDGDDDETYDAAIRIARECKIHTVLPALYLETYHLVVSLASLSGTIGLLTY